MILEPLKFSMIKNKINEQKDYFIKIRGIFSKENKTINIQVNVSSPCIILVYIWNNVIKAKYHNVLYSSSLKIRTLKQYF